ncbi:MAG TPA: hypothetical protein PLL75_06665 [Candidatus Omnitrophota bacterium]|nr:hypothetical protein [Candidatus Omnitrophota bacterium]HPS37390.1 hypothetical protein [Candidatus Omnitrophota bacterium]
MRRDALGFGAVKAGKKVYALVRDMVEAARIVKCAGALHVQVRNFDRAGMLLQQAHQESPFLVILDLEHLEAEAFITLKDMRENADLKDVPAVGFVTQAKNMIKPEAEKAGCFRVYMKTEFGRELPDLLTRYAL